MHLFLFDVDSVLVEAQGYLRALQDTVAYFSRQMGVGEHPPTETEVRALEAGGLTSEWASGPACVVALLIERLRLDPTFPLPASWPETLAALAAHPMPLSHPDYTSLAEAVGRRMAEGTGAAHTAALTGGAAHAGGAAETARSVLWKAALDLPALEARRPALDSLLDALLGHTHDFFRAPVTRHFQHLVIGSRAIAATYGIAADFESPAYLARYDHPLLTSATRAQIEEHITTGRVRAALYTARPSLPPVDVDTLVNGYSPEAEMARSLVQLDAYPLIGLGRMAWLAQRTGDQVERLVKPSPVQALAAVGAARSGAEAASLEAALALHRAGVLRPPLTAVDGCIIHVFEDSAGGIDAVRQGVEALRAAGLNATCQPYGITPPTGPKATAMAARGVETYPSINHAVRAALDTI